MFMFYVLLVPLFRAYGAVLYTYPGHNVTLSCFSDSFTGNYVGWFKQVAGEQPKIISSFYKHLPDINLFYNHFKDDKRFSVHAGEGFYNLSISNVQDSDSAIYYCGRVSIKFTEFDNGIFLVLKEFSHKAFLLQPASDSVKPGDSVTLNCTVQTGTRDGDHSVYWFKEDSTNSHEGIMYIPTDNSSHCVKSLESESPAQSCVYSLSKRNVSRSDAGTYYCAVASCGEILLGKGTRLDVGEKHDDILSVLMLCMVAALIVSVILNIILISILCKMSTRKYLDSGELQPQSTVSEYTSDSQNEESILQYVAVDFKKKQSRSKRKRSTGEEPVYSEVRLSDLE